MKTSIVDRVLKVELHKREVDRLRGVREDIGQLLLTLHKPEGEPLCDAVDAILAKFGPPTNQDEDTNGG